VLTGNPELAKEFWKENPQRLDYLITKYSMSIVRTLKDKEETK
jgi:hypothetical protein